MRKFFNMDNPIFQCLGLIADAMFLNLLFIITCLPIFTIGTSLCALSYTGMKLAKGKDGYIFSTYFKAWKDNFKKGTAIFFIMLALGIMILVDIYFWAHLGGFLGNVMCVFSFLAALIYLMVLLYVFAIQARFENTVKNTIKNAFFMSMRHMPYTILLGIITVGFVALDLTFLLAILISAVVGFAVIAYIQGFIYNRVFKNYMPEEAVEPEEEENSVIN